MIRHRRSLALTLVLLLLTTGCQSGAKIASSTRKYQGKTGFVERKVVVDGFIRPVWVFIPPSYDPNNLYPAILFLHGLFEQGNGNTNVLGAGLGPVIARHPESWPFITIFPQSTGSWQGDDRERLAMAALKDAEHDLAIDPDRVILAGLSFGGQGVWEIGAKNRERFAALVPVSGPATTKPVDQLTSTPIWAFASKEDPIVSASNSEQMCQSVQSHGGRARLTEFDGGEHDCWVQAVDQSDLVTWMLRQARNPMALSAAPTKGVPAQVSGKLRSWNNQ